MLNNVQQLILKEWDNFFEDIENMTDDNFKFIGHSTHSTKYEKDFYSRYVSCSLYTEDINDTFSLPFGFIMGPNNIVGAQSEDMYVYNDAIDQDTLLNYSSIKKIAHPRRIIEECLKQKEESLQENKRKKVYSEIVKDGFEPIGIFCFTDGTKNFNENYKRAHELQKSFPNLKIRTFDVMKKKKGMELDEMKCNLLNNLKSQLLPDTYKIEMDNLHRYDLFFEKFDKLKKIGDYTENEIESLFKYNLELLSIFDKEPDELFSGKYNDIEIKYILGKNLKYNIDDILNGQMRAFSLNNLKKLYQYKNKLNKYYSGLGELVELLSKMEVTDEMIEEMKQINSLNFYTISKYLTNILISILNNKEEQLKFELNQKKNKYMELKKERTHRQELKEKYQFYFNISLNSWAVDRIKIEHHELNEQIVQNQTDYDNYLLEKEKLTNELDRLIIEKEILSISEYQTSLEYQNIQSDIEILKQEIKLLNKHPLINRIKVITKNKTIHLLEQKQKDNNVSYNINREENMNNMNNDITKLKLRIQYLEEQITMNRERKNTLQIDLLNLQKKIKEYFNCDSVLEIDNSLSQAEEYIKHYDSSNNFYLSTIEYELEKIESQIFNQENYIDEIQEEKKKIGKF